MQQLTPRRKQIHFSASATFTQVKQLVADHQNRTKLADSSLAKRSARQADMADGETDAYKRFKQSAQMEDCYNQHHQEVFSQVEHPLRKAERRAALSPKIFK